MNNHDEILSQSCLGKDVIYEDKVNKDLLFAIPRSIAREKCGINTQALPFSGHDLWNGYEFTWLDANSNPVSRFLEIEIPCTSAVLIESKSLKLYLFSYANTVFQDEASVIKQLKQDLSQAIEQSVNVRLSSLNSNPLLKAYPSFMDAFSLDVLDITFTDYHVNPDLLYCDSEEVVEETLSSDLLKSNCLATGKPDWGSVRIHYKGKKISHQGLLRYIVSYREHCGFHEQCVEKMFCDIMTRCQPKKLLVEARYTRRGGLDINPLRMNYHSESKNIRLFRQ